MLKVEAFFSGADTLGYLIAALLLLRAWRRTGDKLFVSFSAAFVLFALNQAAASLGELSVAEQSFVFLLRLGGFALIIVAIAIKNVGSIPR